MRYQLENYVCVTIEMEDKILMAQHADKEMRRIITLLQIVEEHRSKAKRVQFTIFDNKDSIQGISGKAFIFDATEHTEKHCGIGTLSEWTFIGR